MAEVQKMLSKKIKDFLNEIKPINWFENSGSPNEKYHMIFSLYEACDTWGTQYRDVWESQIDALENMAAKEIGDDAVDEVFAAAIGGTVWESFGEFIDRQRLGGEIAVSFELFDLIKRDMAWACMEKILDKPGFFTMLTEIYKEGFFRARGLARILPAMLNAHKVTA